ncbi:hypothetical protein Tco_0566258 [Tanacetum coccineum]
MPRVGDGSTALAAAATVTLSLLEETKPHQNKAVVPDYENVDPECHFLYSKYGLLSSELLVVTDTISGLVIAFESPAIVSAEKAVEIIAKVSKENFKQQRDIRTSDPHALIIDGNSLAFPLDGDIKNTYFWILKALVTRLVKEGTMLQEANISIGCVDADHVKGKYFGKCSLALRTLGGDALNNVVSFMNEEIEQYKSIKIGGASEVKLSTEVKNIFRNSSPLGLDEFHISFQKLLESLLDFPQIRKVLCLADVDQ